MPEILKEGVLIGLVPDEKGRVSFSERGRIIGGACFLGFYGYLKREKDKPIDARTEQEALKRKAPENANAYVRYDDGFVEFWEIPEDIAERFFRSYLESI